jgi:hypothetical protein
VTRVTDGWDDTAGGDEDEDWGEEEETAAGDWAEEDEPVAADWGEEDDGVAGDGRTGSVPADEPAATRRRARPTQGDEPVASRRRARPTQGNEPAASRRRSAPTQGDEPVASRRRTGPAEADPTPATARRRTGRADGDGSAAARRRTGPVQGDEAAAVDRRRARADRDESTAADRRGDWVDADGPEMPDAWRETEGWGEFSWGPEKRPPASQDRSRSVLSWVVAVVAVVVLAAGVVGLVQHHKKATSTTTGGGGTAPRASATTVPPTTTTVTTPAGDERLLDATNQVSLAVPTSWKAVPLTQSGVATQLDSLATSDPANKNLIAFDLASLVRAQVGVFAIDETAGETVFSYGNPSPTIDSLSQVPPAAFTDTLKRAGYRDVTANPVTLPIGPAEQVSAQTTLRGTAVSELFDYFVRAHRVVVFELSVRGTTLPKTLFSQIEATIAGS